MVADIRERLEVNGRGALGWIIIGLLLANGSMPLTVLFVTELLCGISCGEWSLLVWMLLAACSGLSLVTGLVVWSRVSKVTGLAGMVGFVGYTRLLTLLLGWVIVAFSMGCCLYWPLCI